MARRFANLQDMNGQLRHWLDTVANVRVHGTTDRVVAEHFQQERPQLRRLPPVRFDAVLSVQRRISHDGCVSVGGNLYSVPDGTRKRIVDVETTPNQVRILDEGRLIAVHVLLPGRRQRSLLPGHRLARRNTQRDSGGVRLLPGHGLMRRPLGVYELIAQQLGSAR